MKPSMWSKLRFSSMRAKKCLIWAGIVASGGFATKDGVTYRISVSANNNRHAEPGEHLQAPMEMTFRNGSRYHAAELQPEIILNLAAPNSGMEAPARSELEWRRTRGVAKCC